MRMLNKITFSSLSIALLFVLTAGSDLYGQGRGRGGGSGGGRPATSPSSGGGVDRGQSTASSRSNGRSDDGGNTASDKSNGRRDDGIDRARTQGMNRDRALKNAPDDNELNRYRGISKKLGTTPEQLRARYIDAATRNPDLKFGQFVSANVVADNLRGRYPGVTSSAILTGLENGDSLGQTLKNLRVPTDTAKRAEKEAKQRIKDSMPR